MILATLLRDTILPLVYAMSSWHAAIPCFPETLNSDTSLQSVKFLFKCSPHETPANVHSIERCTNVHVHSMELFYKTVTALQQSLLSNSSQYYY